MLTNWVEITLALAVTVERIVEIVWIAVEHHTNFTIRIQKANPDQYKKLKEVVSFVLGLMIGIFLAPGVVNLVDSTVTDMRIYLVVGVVAGTIAPYSHQLISLIIDFRQQLQKDDDTANLNLS